MKKFFSIVLALSFVFSLSACGSENAASSPAEEKFVVGICQLVQHPALDAATEGFIDALKDELGDKVSFDNQNASNDIPTCATICNGFAASKVDLILANATPALQAAAAATDTIPILGTAITEYGVALDIDNFNGTVGGNISGTSDLSPLDQQAQMICDLFPSAKTVAILYCSAEANSKYQVNVVKAELEKKGIKVNALAFTDSNDVSSVTEAACQDADVIFIPTDNTAASCAENIGNICETKGVPIIAGEEGVAITCGVATLTINYYDLGITTGKMAAKILNGEMDIANMPIEYFPNPVKKYNKELANKYNVQIPSDFVAIEG